MTDTTTSAGPDAETLPELTVMDLFMADWEKTKANPTHGNLHYFGAVLGLFVQDYINRVDEVAADRDRLAAEVERLTAILTDHNADCVQQCEARKKAGRTQCPMQGYNRLCSDCPRDGMIDAQIAAPPSPETPVREGGE